jgi:hypothetical protein
MKSRQGYYTLNSIASTRRGETPSRALPLLQANCPISAYLSSIYGSFLAGALMRNSRGALFARISFGKQTGRMESTRE